MMFARLVWKLLRGSRGRLAVAIVALVSGAAVISALLNLDLDVERKLTQEFRAYGANLVLAPLQDSTGSDMASAAVTMSEASVVDSIDHPPVPGVVAAAAPFLYLVGRARESQVVVVGTWLDQAPKLSPTWKLDGEWVASRADDTHCLVGRNVARQFTLSPGSLLDLAYQNRSARFTVAGVIDSGAADDNQIFVNLSAAQALAAKPGAISLAQFAVTGTPATVTDFAARLAKIFALADEVHPIRQVTEAEGAMLHRIQLLVVSMVLLILVLTALCVLATMAALAMERREDVGLMKALGGSISRVVGIFFAEVSVLGAVGGVIGCLAGVALSHWMGRRVFGASISARWEIFPLTIALMVGVALAGALPLRLLGKVKPAVILRGE
jgi:putative ABC transport system permease protein